MTAAVPIRINIDYDLEGLFATERDRREVLKSAWGDLGLHWHQEYLPRHFKPGAASRYGYRPRTAGYLRRKLRMARGGKAIEGGTTPLVLTGLLRRSLTTLATIKAYPSRFTVLMTSPVYAPQRPRDSTRPPLVEEATRLRADEARALSNKLASRITFHNNRVRRRRRVTIK